MFTSTHLVRELKAERAALWTQLDVETRTRAFCPGLDLDEYREMRRRVNKRMTEIDLTLAEYEAAKKNARACQKPKGFLRRVLTVVF
jgi:hypothetical protein